MAAKTKKLGLATKILLAMVVGAAFGFIFKGSYDIWGQVTQPIGTIFIRLLKMTIIPLVFFSIVCGVASVANLQRLKKVGGTFLVFWFLASMLAAISGIFWAYVIEPGVGIHLAEKAAFSTKDVSVVNSLVNWFPDNVFASFTNFNILQVIIFSLFLGFAIALLPAGSEAKRLLSKGFEVCNTAITKVVEIVMVFAPLGVLCLMADVTGTLGTEVLTGLGKMLVTQYVAYATVLLVMFPIILKFIAKVSPLRHYANVFPAMILAFSTCSSSATLPLTMKCSKERAGVPDETVNLLAPPAATINMQACCAEMPIYAIFAAQMFGLDFGFGQLVLICFLGIIMAAGVAGVPGGGIMMSAIMMQTMGLPLTIVPWVAGIYRLIDMPNTMLNVTGDTVGMVTTASLLGTLDRDKFNAPKSIYG
ncbi:dicarboxylate/amino acid:cation symporter [Mesosutterella sp. OilRF-GAM-744-9]|uniref:Dicarboxylate/amino acid:cation symporter n=1 Tax=Mesosutterella porci TaxID=2915351 RepID=A0ABS9MTR1_9BURK|nr:dicarboxylate/amino acid:cation symporter [Mesosutterella sp. oilRF-744-WT-GAM-9]MCG5031937.1 dicarboxylate/amino acid:cation symporter [Mesosutterella sp. oilRF-744-WT-GAM-9]